jgi:Phosphoesterase family
MAVARRLKATSVLFFPSVAWLSLACPAQGQSDRARPVGTHFDHVILVVMENHGASHPLSDSNIAALVKLAAWFSNYHALAHPSLPNYLALVAGSTFGLTADRVETPLKARSIVHRLEQKGLSWKSYAEDFPGHCLLGVETDDRRLTPKASASASYSKRHVPLLLFAAVQNDSARCARVVNAREFMNDARAAPLRPRCPPSGSGNSCSRCEAPSPCVSERCWRSSGMKG